MRTRGMVLTLLLVTGAASAQEPPYGDSATQPSPGHVTIKQSFRLEHLRRSEAPNWRRLRLTELGSETVVNYGLLRDLSVSLRVPATYRHARPDAGGEIDRDGGLGDVAILAKWRFFQRDTSALNTQRVALLGGIELRSGDGSFSSDSYDPLLGLAYTQIIDRHGVNASVLWKFTTDGLRDPVVFGESRADALRYDAAYLYRIAPARFTAESRGAWYLASEFNGRYETNGDHQVFFSPGIMYEAARWVVSLSVQIPAYQDVDHRPETRFGVLLGLRVTF